MDYTPVRSPAVGLTSLCLLLVLAGCYNPNGTLPEPPKARVAVDHSTADVDALVEQRFLQLASPASTFNGPVPAACDQIQYYQFRLRSAPEPDAVLVLMPGVYSGANVFSYLAKELIYAAHTRTDAAPLNLEVLAVDRRDNCIEDLTGLNAAEQARDTQVALDYYFNGVPLDGQLFDGFKSSDDVPYLSEMGLAQVMEDVHAVLTTHVPDPLQRQQKAFIGGHSMGASLAWVYAGWDFDGDETTLADAGYQNVAGVIRLDSRYTPADSQEAAPLPATENDAVIADYLAKVERLRDGRDDRVAALPGLSGETMSLLEIQAMEAHWHPDDEALLLRNLEQGADTRLLLTAVHSRDLFTVLRGTPTFNDFRYTNRAALGVILDDNFMPVPIIQASMGHLSAGPVVSKRFPADALSLVSGLLGDFARLLGDGKNLFIASDAGPNLQSLGQGPLYDWADFDQVGDASDPDYTGANGKTLLTTTRNEVSNLQDVARVLYEGETNFTEWYMSQRLMLDQQFIRGGKRIPGLPFLHEQESFALPLIEIGAEQFSGYPTFATLGEAVVAEGHNHLDVLLQSANTSAYRHNDVIPPLLQFVEATVR